MSEKPDNIDVDVANDIETDGGEYVPQTPNPTLTVSDADADVDGAEPEIEDTAETPMLGNGKITYQIGDMEVVEVVSTMPVFYF